jgi:hypothetical protein
MKTRVTVIGAKELMAKFKQMEIDAAGPLLDTAVRGGAEVMRNAVVTRAPIKDGDLRRSITVRKSRARDKLGRFK